jgi:hypothetical protein
MRRAKKYSVWATGLFALSVAIGEGCGPVDGIANQGYDRFENKKPPTIVRPVSAEAGTCTPLDAGTCDVKLSGAVATIFKNSCTSCHSGSYEPKMPADNLKELWDNLKAYRGTTSKLPYITDCTADPSASYIIDNLKGDDLQKGGQRMPQGQALPTDDIAVIEKWVKCGAPFN